jgi:hypothetical protein
MQLLKFNYEADYVQFMLYLTGISVTVTISVELLDDSKKIN